MDQWSTDRLRTSVLFVFALLPTLLLRVPPPRADSGDDRGDDDDGHDDRDDDDRRGVVALAAQRRHRQVVEVDRERGGDDGDGEQAPADTGLEEHAVPVDVARRHVVEVDAERRELLPRELPGGVPLLAHDPPRLVRAVRQAVEVDRPHEELGAADDRVHGRERHNRRRRLGRVDEDGVDDLLVRAVGGEARVGQVHDDVLRRVRRVEHEEGFGVRHVLGRDRQQVDAEEGVVPRVRPRVLARHVDRHGDRRAARDGDALLDPLRFIDGLLGALRGAHALDSALDLPPEAHNVAEHGAAGDRVARAEARSAGRLRRAVGADLRRLRSHLHRGAVDLAATAGVAREVDRPGDRGDAVVAVLVGRALERLLGLERALGAFARRVRLRVAAETLRVVRQVLGADVRPLVVLALLAPPPEEIDETPLRPRLHRGSHFGFVTRNVVRIGVRDAHRLRRGAIGIAHRRLLGSEGAGGPLRFGGGLGGTKVNAAEGVDRRVVHNTRVVVGFLLGRAGGRRGVALLFVALVPLDRPVDQAVHLAVAVARVAFRRRVRHLRRFGRRARAAGGGAHEQSAGQVARLVQQPPGGLGQRGEQLFEALPRRLHRVERAADATEGTRIRRRGGGWHRQQHDNGGQGNQEARAAVHETWREGSDRLPQ
mmetsp:Transcript_49706/g.153589  ORF Transcript_49706/g.153589 Transcript_49706/m.153589 type:complete len:653 (-) Transcript_49706:16-1974(-)